MKKKISNIILIEKIKNVPIKIYVMTLIFFLLPFLLEAILVDVELYHMQFLLQIIPTFFWTYYIGLVAGFIGALFSNVLFLGYEWFEISRIGVFSQNDFYHILTITIVNFVLPISIGFLANKLITQRDIIERIAITDPLTKIYNRRYLIDQLKGIKDNKRVALIYIDLDDYKNINDTLGHQVGDEFLEEVGKRLNIIAKEEMAFRIGGDEFVILCTEHVDDNHICEISNSVKESIATPIRINHHKICLTASIGVSIYPDHTDCPEKLLNTADIAMYNAKKLGKDKVELYSTSN